MGPETVATVIREQHFEKAGQLFALLNPIEDRWHNGPGPWVYRGHGQDSWKLVPSAVRPTHGQE